MPPGAAGGTLSTQVPCAVASSSWSTPGRAGPPDSTSHRPASFSKTEISGSSALGRTSSPSFATSTSPVPARRTLATGGEASSSIQRSDSHPNASSAPSASATRSPGESSLPSTKVPLLLPRSRTSHRSPVQNIEACSADTPGSSSRSRHAGARPTTTRADSDRCARVASCFRTPTRPG
jgi:hypothetical protein